MGSENLSHKFAIKDPTYKENSSSSKHKDEKFSSQHSLSHTSGTQPVSISNGPNSSSSPIIKHKRKPNSKHRKLTQFNHYQNRLIVINIKYFYQVKNVLINLMKILKISVKLHQNKIIYISIN
jgi:hypothetical protein